MTDKAIKNQTIKISGTIIKGYGVASGNGEDKTFPAGTIKMQAPFFKELSLIQSQQSYFLSLDLQKILFQLKLDNLLASQTSK